MNNLSAVRRTICGMKVKTAIINADSGLVEKQSGWQHNTIMDGGLNAMAAGAGFYNVFKTIKVGSDGTQNYVFNSGISFTQSGNVITASGAIFTSGMTGWLFKYGTGTGGIETYITAFTDSTHVTVDTSLSVGTSAGTIWNVIRTSLGAYLYMSTASVSGSTTVVSPGVLQLSVTRTFAVQALPYNVNEIGYCNNITDDGTILGRIVLASTDIVPPTSFLQVTAVMTYTISPCSAPVSVPNTAVNFNNAGSALWNYYACQAVKPDGSVNSYAGLLGGLGCESMDSAVPVFVGFCVLPFTQPSATLATAPPINSFSSFWSGSASFVNTGGVGVSVASGTFNLTTTGQTAYGYSIGAISPATDEFRVLFTTPQVLPNGAFTGTFSFTNIFSRTLSNP